MLIDYIIKEPLSDDQNIGHKYPFNASEILVSENGFFIDKYYEGLRNDDMKEAEDEKIEKKVDKKNGKQGSSNKELSLPNYEVLNYLFSFLETKEELNYVLAGYFSKVFIHLVTHRQDLVILFYNLFIRRSSTYSKSNDNFYGI